MSEPVLERSVLERKERDELLTIARHMGATPPARVRKAALVDLILTTAGIGVDAPAGGEGGAEAEEPPAKPAPLRKRRSRAGREAEEQPDAGEEAPSLFDEGAGAQGVEKAPEAPGADDAPTRRRGRPRRVEAPVPGDDPSDGDERGDDGRSGAGRGSGDGRRDAGRNRGDDRNDAERSGGNDRNDAERSRGNDRSDADRNRGDDRNRVDDEGDRAQRGDDGAPRGGDDDGEGGNRRRRRRGRDRDRNPSDEGFAGEPVEVAGLLDLRDEGYGFLRTKGYLPSKDDVYVSVKQVRQFALRKGDHVAGASRPAGRNEKNPALLRIDQVNDKDPETSRARPRFDELTAVHPTERIRLERADDGGDPTGRLVDLLAPVGRGQRGLIASPPRGGRTSVLEQVVRAIEANEPDAVLVVLLIDERPEDVTDLRRATSAGEVVASPFDRPADEHASVSDLVIERAKRLVEEGRDVVVVLDGITRLARAHRQAPPPTGRSAPGGVDTGGLYPAKRFLGAARNIEDGGSLTILATVGVDSGSRVDEAVYEEVAGAANMELRLDRRLAEQRVFPAVDVVGSSTSNEALLVGAEELEQRRRVRRALHALAADGASPGVALDALLDAIRAHATNDELLAAAFPADS